MAKINQTIAVISPFKRSGATVVSTLLAQALSFNGWSTMLLYSAPDSPCADYLSLENLHDPMRSPMQIVKLVEAGEMKAQDILPYAVTYSPNAYIMHAANSTLSEKDLKQSLKFLYTSAPVDCCVCDLSDDLDRPIVSDIIAESDVVFMVVPPGKQYHNRMHEWLQSPLLKDSNVYIVINNWHEVINPMRVIAKEMRLQASRVCKLHYSPYLTRTCNQGTLHQVYPLVHTLDERVACLKADTSEMVKCVTASRLTALRAEKR